MKIKQLLGETLNMAQYLPDVMEMFYGSLVHAIPRITRGSDQTKNLAMTFVHIFSGNMVSFFQDKNTGLKKIKLGRTGGAEALADNGIITMNRRNLYDFMEQIWETLGTRRMSAGKIKASIQDDYVLSQEIRQLCSLILHEITHVYQQYQQELRGLSSREYRSYLSDPRFKDKSGEDEFLQLHRDPKNYGSARYKLLYSASPQEIAAFSNQIAMDIISNNNLDELPIQDLPQARELMTDINTSISQYTHLDPRIPEQAKIYNKYRKQVYQVVDQYLDRLRNSYALS